MKKIIITEKKKITIILKSYNVYLLKTFLQDNL